MRSEVEGREEGGGTLREDGGEVRDGVGVKLRRYLSSL